MVANNRVHKIDQQWRVSPNVRANIEREGGLLLDLHKGLCYSVNRTAAVLWDKLMSSEGGTTFEAIVKQLVEECGAPRNHAEDDAQAFLTALEKKGLVSSL